MLRVRAVVEPSSRRQRPQLSRRPRLHSPRACLRSVVRNRGAPSATLSRSPPITRIFRRSCCGRFAPASEPARHAPDGRNRLPAVHSPPLTCRPIILIIAARQRAALLDIGDGFSGQAAGRTRAHFGVCRSRVGPDQIPPADRGPAQLRNLVRLRDRIQCLPQQDHQRDAGAQRQTERVRSRTDLRDLSVPHQGLRPHRQGRRARDR